MLSYPLLLHLMLAFAVGSSWVTIVTIIAERVGTTVGGVLGGLPSTSAFTFFFIGVNQSPEAASQATTVFPLAFGFTCVFLLLYALFARKGFREALSLSLLAWFAFTLLTAVSGLADFTLALVGGIAISLAVYFAFRVLSLRNLAGAKIHYTPLQLVERSILAGALVFVSVLLSQVGGPILGGISSAFPAVFTSTLYIVNRSRGSDFSRAITKPLMLSGSLTIFPYSVAVRLLYPVLGIWLGTLISYGVVVPLAVLSYYIIARDGQKMKSAAAKIDSCSKKLV